MLGSDNNTAHLNMLGWGLEDPLHLFDAKVTCLVEEDLIVHLLFQLALRPFLRQ